MEELLFEHFRRFIELPDDDKPGIISFFRTVKIRKKQSLLIEGQISKSMYFVLKGCLRMFFVDEKGVEQTTQFAIENWWLADYLSFQNQRASHFHIQAVENSDLLSIDLASLDAMLSKFPVLERYFRLIHQKEFGASQQRMRFNHTFSGEEMYRHFANAYPQFIQRVPQYLVASFLGITPEYLSEIRKKYVLKPV